MKLFHSTPNSRFSTARRVGVLALAAGLFATVALPAYALTGDELVAARDLSGSQSVSVEAAATVLGVSAESYTSASAGGGQIMASGRTGPSIAQLLANPPSSSYDGGSIYGSALSLQGVPYVYGGESPAGFDCSGYVAYVFAMHGIALPHSATGQTAGMGTQISEADAQLGDLVLIDGHSGFWAGPGMILHSPYAGSVVRIQALWGGYSVYRLGI